MDTKGLDVGIFSSGIDSTSVNSTASRYLDVTDEEIVHSSYKTGSKSNFKNQYFVTQVQTASSGLFSFPFDLANSSEMPIESNNIKETHKTCLHIAFFIGLVFAVACTVSVLFFYYFNSYPEIWYLNQEDVKFPMFFLSFCSQVRARSLSSHLHILMFNRNCKKEAKSVHSYNEKIDVYPSDVWQRNFYLESGSSIKLNLRSAYSLDVYIFVGRRKYLDWSHNMHTKSLLEPFPCPIIVNTSQSDNYFIVLYNKNQNFPVSTDIDIVIDRLSCSMSPGFVQCASLPGKWCSSPINLKNRNPVAIHVQSDQTNLTIPQSSEVNCECVARVWLYIVVFFVPCIFGLFCIIFGYYISVRCFRYSANKKSHKHDLYGSKNCVKMGKDEPQWTLACQEVNDSNNQGIIRKDSNLAEIKYHESPTYRDSLDYVHRTLIFDPLLSSPEEFQDSSHISLEELAELQISKGPMVQHILQQSHVGSNFRPTSRENRQPFSFVNYSFQESFSKENGNHCVGSGQVLTSGSRLGDLELHNFVLENPVKRRISEKTEIFV